MTNNNELTKKLQKLKKTMTLERLALMLDVRPRTLHRWLMGNTISDIWAKTLTERLGKL